MRTLGKRLECECGFAAGGPDTGLDELKDIAVAHIKVNHPDLLSEHGEEGVRANTESFVRDV